MKETSYKAIAPHWPLFDTASTETEKKAGMQYTSKDDKAMGGDTP